MNYIKGGRCVLTAILIYGVWTETGKWTALAFVCVFLGLEKAGTSFVRINAILKQMNGE